MLEVREEKESCVLEVREEKEREKGKEEGKEREKGEEEEGYLSLRRTGLSLVMDEKEVEKRNEHKGSEKEGKEEGTKEEERRDAGNNPKEWKRTKHAQVHFVFSEDLLTSMEQSDHDLKVGHLSLEGVDESIESLHSLRMSIFPSV